MQKIILASKSKHRAQLLQKLNVPFTVKPADVDESVLKNEAPLAYIKRIAAAKAAKVAAENPGQVVLAADTPVIVGRRILQTPQTRQEAVEMLRLQSGRRVHIPTVVVVADDHGKLSSKTVDNWVKFKPLTKAEIEAYLDLNEWNFVSGALKYENIEPWITLMHGSLSGIIGLPLYETILLLRKAGITPNPHAKVSHPE